MMPSRRDTLRVGGALLAGFAGIRPPLAGQPIEIRMQGNADGSHVWFDPVGLHIQPGQEVRWLNLDPGNSHTATAYHPKNFGRPLRIPEGAEPWDSDYLLPTETFAVTLTREGIYDFFCIPHEQAGMVGRIIVGRLGSPLRGGTPSQESGLGAIPEAALQAFPSIEEIMTKGIVHRS